MLRWRVASLLSLGESKIDSLEAGMPHWGNGAECIGMAFAGEVALRLFE